MSKKGIKKRDLLMKTRKSKQESKVSVKSKTRSHKKASFRSYERLSPFELKNKLIKLANIKGEKGVLNAGRGNPNFFNDFVRKCFANLMLVCLKISKGIPGKIDIASYYFEDEINFVDTLKKLITHEIKDDRVVDFLISYIDYLIKQSKKEGKKPNFIIRDVIISILGCFYPEPPQIQPHLPLLVEKFMFDLVYRNKVSNETPEKYEYFATEGAAAGILYVFNTLSINKLLNPGDSIAIITPIFSPYLEMPKMKAYGLNIIELKGDPENDYALSTTEIYKLKNKEIKALFMVNPANPGEYSLPLSNINEIGEIVNKERKDLIIVSDNVYAPFVDEYNSLMYSCPKNTIEIFSLSKYFGVTGWRLGLVMIRKQNNLNSLFKGLSKENKKILDDRYSIATLKPEKLTLMERIIMDSRQVAEAHVGGLSTPQQVMMGLMLYYNIYDDKKFYKSELQELLEMRMKYVYHDLDYLPDMLPSSTNYYSLIPILKIVKEKYGEQAFGKISIVNPIEFLFRLAKKYQVILLPGAGFGAEKWKLRVSLANLPSDDYLKISKAIDNCIKDFI